MRIDVRENQKDDVVDEIVFGEDGEVIQKAEATTFYVTGEDETSVELWISDIDNMIKALEKARELWG